MQIVLSTSSGVPMYEQIKTCIRLAIHAGEVAPGEHLPSLRHLAADLRVSLMTTTRAYNDLVAEGLVQNEHGRGFIVLPIDANKAQAALDERLLAAVSDAVVAATAARMTREQLHELVDKKWNRDERQRD